MVSFLFRNSNSYPHKPALIDADLSITLSYSELKSVVIKVAHGLLNLGISKNDVVLIVAPNSYQFPICFLAIISTGAITTTANPLYTTSELSKQIKDSNPKLIITVPELWDKVKGFNVPAVFLGPKRVPLPLESGSRIRSFDSLVEDYRVSKGVVLTHGNFIAASLMVTMDQVMAGEMHNVFLCFLPMFHVFGLAVVTYSQLQMGNAVVSMVVLALAKQNLVKKYDLSSLKNIGSGAAPLGKDLMKECAKNLPGTIIAQGYGMTETSGIVSMEDSRLGTRHSGSAGMLAAGIEAQIHESRVRFDHLLATNQQPSPTKLGCRQVRRFKPFLHFKSRGWQVFYLVS
ncbi:Ca4CL [Salix suchowensis]|nr:Ca4CL [Salix suchowensis]